MAIEQNAEGLYDVIIGDETYSFAKWGAEEALTNLIKISKMVGKPLGILLGGALGGEDETLFGEKKSLLEREINPDMISLAMEAITANMDESSMIPLIKALTSKDVMCDGRRITFNKHYEGRMMTVFKVIKAGLEVQYGNFFEELLEVAPIKKRPISNLPPTT